MKRSPVVLLVVALFAVLGLSQLGSCVAPPSYNTNRDGGRTGADIGGGGSCDEPRTACCTGGICSNNLTCSANGQCCGGNGYNCDTAAECCSGLSCSADKRCCVAESGTCTDRSECCTGLTCNANHECERASGQEGDPCDASDADSCASGFECKSGMCTACGTSNEPCCASASTKCDPGLACNTTSSTCVAVCGGPGQGCCTTGTQCNDPALTCLPSNKCGSTTPGSLGYDCTSNPNVCNTGLMCIGGVCQPVPTCVNEGDPCCATSPRCQNGLQCGEDDKCHAPPACTAVQQDCTTQAQCCSGLSCSKALDVNNATRQYCCAAAGQACPGGGFDCCGTMPCGTTSHTCIARGDGATCLNDGDCTSGKCTGGFCGTAGCSGGQATLGNACTDIGDCCDGIDECSRLASTGDNACCQDPGSMCTTSKDCCGQMLCNTSSHVCIARTSGQSCIEDFECASGLYCNGSKKCASSGSSGIPLGDACSSGGSTNPCDHTGENSDVGCSQGHCQHQMPHTNCTDNDDCNPGVGMTCEQPIVGKVCCVANGKGCTASTQNFCCSFKCGSNNKCTN